MNELETSIIKKINELLEIRGIPGLAIGIVRDNTIAYVGGFGIKDIVKKEPIQPDSIFHTSSVSKLFVVMALMLLLEQGKIDLNTPITKYIPYFKLKDINYKKITIKQLLNHSSGLPDVDNKTVYDSSEVDDLALERYVKNLSERNLLFIPGTRFGYSDIGYNVLGDIIAKVSGISFEAYMKKNILLPLEMKKSTFLKNEIPKNELVLPHVRKQKRLIVSEKYPYSRDQAPSSTFHSNVIELCNFMIANLNDGRFNGKQILKKSTYDLLWEPLIKTNMDEHNAHVGLGWFIGKYRGTKIVGHSGGEFGFLAHLFLFPEKSLGIVMLMNSFHSPEWDLITSGFLDIILGHKPQFLDKTQFNFFKQLISNHLEDFKKKEIIVKKQKKKKKKKKKKTIIREKILKFLAKSETGATVTRINEGTSLHRNTIKSHLEKMENEGLVYSQIVGSFTLWFVSPSQKGIVIEMYEINYYNYFNKFLAAFFQELPISEEEMKESMIKIGKKICKMNKFPFNEFDFKSKFILEDGTLDILTSANFLKNFLQSSKMFGNNLECEIVPPLDTNNPLAALIRIKILNLEDKDSFLIYFINCGFIDQLLQKFDIPLNFSIKSFQMEAETCYYELSIKEKK